MVPVEGETTAHLTPKTTVPLLWVVGIVVALISSFGVVLGAYSYLENRFNGQREHTDASFSNLEKRLISIEASSGDRWAKSDMREWIADLKTDNPTLKIPRIASD